MVEKSTIYIYIFIPKLFLTILGTLHSVQTLSSDARLHFRFTSALARYRLGVSYRGCAWRRAGVLVLLAGDLSLGGPMSSTGSIPFEKVV